MITLTLTEEKIITKIRQLSPDEIQKLEEFIDQLSQSSDSTEKPHPWLEFAGIFKDDPSFDEFVEAMAEERRRLYLEEMAAYDEEEITTEL
jgi:hypothetical protein